jgi:aryl-alcohol dehydrogenase-like predicted oxidoreductase
MQNHYNLAYREEEREMIPLCRDQGIALIPFSPLAKGFLTSKYRQGEISRATRYESDKLLRERFFKPEDFDVVEAVQAVANEKGVTPAQVAIAWLLHKGVTAPIVGPTKVEHVEEAVGAVDVKMNASDMERLEVMYKPHRILGHE